VGFTHTVETECFRLHQIRIVFFHPCGLETEACRLYGVKLLRLFAQPLIPRGCFVPRSDLHSYYLSEYRIAVKKP
jgi:hypothetical protein